MTVVDQSDDWVKYQLAHMPAPMLGVWGTKWAQLLGGAKSKAAALVIDAILARFPNTAPSDALAKLGLDRRIPRAPDESEDAYRDRLLLAFTIWGMSGRPDGISSGFVAAGLPSPTIVQNYQTSGALGHWARFAIYVEGTGVFDDPPLWDDFDWDDGTRWDVSAADGLMIDYLVAWVRLMMPSYTRCLGIVVTREGFPPITIPVDPDMGVALPDPADILTGTYLDMYLDSYLG